MAEFQIDIVDLRFDINLTNFRAIGFGLQLVGLDDLRRWDGSRGRKIRCSVELWRGRRLVFPQEHRHSILLLFHGSLRRNGDFAPALDFLAGLDHVERRYGSGFGSALHLPQPFFRDSERPALHIHEFGRGHPVPKLGGCGQEQILSGLGNLHLGARIRQLRALQLGIFRVDHESLEEGHESTQDDLLIAVSEGEVGDFCVADRLAKSRTAPESPRGARFDQGVVKSHTLCFGGTLVDKPFDLGVIDQDRLEGAEGFEHFAAGGNLFRAGSFQQRMRPINPSQDFVQ